MTEAKKHFLVVTDEQGDRGYDVEHPNCGYEEQESFLEGVPTRFYTCDVAAVLDAGIEYALDGVGELPPGRYEIAAEHQHTPSTVNGPAEWDSWLVLVEGNP